MMEAQEKTRVQIGLVQPDDDMRQEFQGAIQKQEQSRIDMQFEQMLRPPEPKIDGVTGPKPKPAEGNQPAEVTIQPRSVGQMAGAAVSDVAGGAIEAPKQVFGGVMDALNEVSDALESVLPLGEMLGGIEIMDPKTGEFTLRPLSGEEMKAREDQVFEALAPAEAETVTGNFVRTTSQFLTGFIPAMKGAKALGASGGIATQLGAGAVADAVVFDPHEDRLATFLNEVPALAPIVPDYLAETDPAKVSELQGRLANAIEGAGLGVATEGLMKAFKYYRAARQAKLQNKPEATAEEAAGDAIREAAREELIEPIDEASLRGLGDPDEAAVVVAAQDETLDTALGRLQETRDRLAAEGVLPEDIDNMLSKEVSSQTKSSDFQSWFKGSKVSQKNGNPRIVFRGQNADFPNIDPAAGSSVGAWFGATAKEVEPFGDVREYYLSIKNPGSLSDFAQARKTAVASGFDPQTGGREFNEAVIAEMKSRGFDGVVTNSSKGAGGNEAFVAFDADQVRPVLSGPRKKAKVFLNMARIKSREDVKEALQLFADADAEAINAKRRGKVSNAQTAREAQKEFTELTDLIGRKPGPMSAAEAVAARRMLTASGEQTVALARKAADPGATSADLYNFRRAMLVHYAIQSEVIAARTETARALQSWSIASRATKGAQGVVCVL
jgi:hypothetical protein